MTDDLVKRLRDHARHLRGYAFGLAETCDLLDEAATRLSAQPAEKSAAPNFYTPTDSTATNTISPLPAPPAEVEAVEGVARAIESVDRSFGYSISLVRLVDGVSTDTLSMPGHEPSEHPSHDDALDLAISRRNTARAAAVIAALAVRPSGAEMGAVEVVARRALRTQAEHIEALAAAFLYRTGLNPEQCELVQENRGDRIVWFFQAKEPRP